MILLPVAAAFVVAGGAVAALSARDQRAALLGLALALVAAGLLLDPLPSPAILGVRLVTALLAAAILRTDLPDDDASDGSTSRRVLEPGSRLGWPSELLLGGAGAVAGVALAIGLAGLTALTPGGDARAPGALDGLLRASTLAVGAAGFVLAIVAGPAILDRFGLRRAIALVLLAQAGILLRVGLAGPPSDLEELVLAGLLVVTAVAGAILSSASRPESADAPRP